MARLPPVTRPALPSMPTVSVPRAASLEESVDASLNLPAVLYLGLWFALQVLSGLAESADSQSGGVAWWAHIGGFVAGLVLVAVLGRRKRRAPRD